MLKIFVPAAAVFACLFSFAVPASSWTGGIRILATFNAVVKNGDTTYQNR